MSTTTDDPPLRPDPAEPPARGGVTLDGAGLTVEDVVRLADGAAVPDVPPTALERAAPPGLAAAAGRPWWCSSAGGRS
ncbi:hypothetical protein AB0K92_30755, partial [Streptomyces sp. NPDC052687]